MNRCEEIIKNEKDNLFNIKQNTINELLILIYKDLVYQFSNDIISNIDNGFLINLKNNNVDNISQLYRLFVNNYNILENINKLFDNNIKKDFECIINTYSLEKKINYINLIDNIIEIYNKYNKIIKESLESNNLYQLTLSKILGNYFEKKLCSQEIYLYLVQYINYFLTHPNQEVDSKIKDSIILFKFINSKDIFIEKYQNFLSNRLLKINNLDIDVEKNIISNIKIECGYTFVNKLKLMIKDYLIFSNNVPFTF